MVIYDDEHYFMAGALAEKLARAGHSVTLVTPNPTVSSWTAMTDEQGFLQARLHEIEHLAGRLRTERWGPRTLDLDLIDYHGLIRRDAPPVLPHPGIAARIFVLAPIAEIAPHWRHPETHLTAAEMLQRLDQQGEGGLR